MNKAIIIVKHKVRNLIKESIIKAISPKLTVYATELRLLTDFLSSLINDYTMIDLERYIVEVLNHNNFLKIQVDMNQIKKINQELKYLYQFVIEPSQQKNNFVVEDWTHFLEIPALVNTLYNETKVLTTKFPEVFSIFGYYQMINLQSSFPNSLTIRKLFEELQKNNKEIKQIETLKHDFTSNYYEDKLEKEFSHFRDVTTYDTALEAYTDQERYEYEEDAPVRTGIFHFATFGISTLATGGMFTDTKVGYRDVNKNRNVTKLSYYEKEPVMKTVIRRRLNESLYNTNLTKENNAIAANRKNLINELELIKKSNSLIEKSLGTIDLKKSLIWQKLV